MSRFKEIVRTLLCLFSGHEEMQILEKLGCVIAILAPQLPEVWRWRGQVLFSDLETVTLPCERQLGSEEVGVCLLHSRL